MKHLSSSYITYYASFFKGYGFPPMKTWACLQRECTFTHLEWVGFTQKQESYFTTRMLFCVPINVCLIMNSWCQLYAINIKKNSKHVNNKFVILIHSYVFFTFFKDPCVSKFFPSIRISEIFGNSISVLLFNTSFQKFGACKTLKKRNEQFNSARMHWSNVTVKT